MNYRRDWLLTISTTEKVVHLAQNELHRGMLSIEPPDEVHLYWPRTPMNRRTISAPQSGVSHWVIVSSSAHRFAQDTPFRGSN